MKQWVTNAGDAAAVEADIVVSRQTIGMFDNKRELLTVAEMRARGLPDEKIQAVIAKGGFPDADCPQALNLYRYWVVTSTVLRDQEIVKQEATMRAQARGDAATVGALMTGPTGPANRRALPQSSMDDIMKDLANSVGGQGLDNLK